MTYFITREGTQSGPFTSAQVSEQLRIGSIALGDMSWREGDETWLKLGDRPEFKVSRSDQSSQKASQPKIRFKAVIGCVALILALQLVGGAIIPLFRIPFESENMPFLMDVASVIANLLGFFLAGLLFKDRRWIHLLLAWVGVCGFNFVCFLFYPQVALVSGAIWMLGELLLAGWVSGLIQKRSQASAG
jgi:hypothetical protein